MAAWSFPAAVTSRVIGPRRAVAAVMAMGGGGRGRSAFTISPGGHVGFLNGYGPVGFGQLEAAWELRTRFGLALVVGGGVGLTLTSSRRVGDCNRTFWQDCHDRFDAGEDTLHLRAELGYAF